MAGTRGPDADATRESAPRPRPDANTLVAGGLLLTAAPGVGYLIVWIHDFGYANHFHIPSELIAPQLGEVLSTAIGLAAAIAILFTFVEGYLFIRRYRVGPVETRLWAVAAAGLLFALVLFSAWGAPWDWRATALWASIVVPLAAIVLGEELIYSRNPDGKSPSARPLALVKALIDRVGPLPFVLGVAILVSLQGAYDLGIDSARTQDIFLVSSGSPPEVVLAIWGDTVVMAPFDQKTLLVSRDLDIVKIGAQPLHLTRTHMGPLKTQCSDPSIPEGSYYNC